MFELTAMLTQFTVVTLAMLYARNYFTVTAFVMVSSFAIFNWLIISVLGYEPAVYESDFVFYLAINFLLFSVFAFCFAYLISIKRCIMPMAMMALSSIQALMCLVLIINGGTFPSTTFGDVTFTFSDGVTSVITALNDIIWTVECVVVWIAAYTARNSTCFKG
ncbi:MAG: hypothetical protein AAGJ17_00050 [Pseudomonadota bacterium]